MEDDITMEGITAMDTTTTEATVTDEGITIIMDTDITTEDATERSRDVTGIIEMPMTIDVMENIMETEPIIEPIAGSPTEATTETIAIIQITDITTEITLHVIHGYQTEQDQVITADIKRVRNAGRESVKQGRADCTVCAT